MKTRLQQRNVQHQQIRVAHVLVPPQRQLGPLFRLRVRNGRGRTGGHQPAQQQQHTLGLVQEDLVQNAERALQQWHRELVPALVQQLAGPPQLVAL